MISDRHVRAVGLFKNHREAETALNGLKASGFNMNQISIIARHADSESEIAGVETRDRIDNKSDEGATTGAITGGALGGLTGLLVGLGVLAIPGIGPVMLAGAGATALATTLSGGAIGAATGGLLGAMIGFGIPEEQAKVYNQRISNGDYMVMLEGTESEINRAATILSSGGVQEWEIYPQANPSGTGISGTSSVHDTNPKVIGIDRNDTTL